MNNIIRLMISIFIIVFAIGVFIVTLLSPKMRFKIVMMLVTIIGTLYVIKGNQ